MSHHNSMMIHVDNLSTLATDLELKELFVPYGLMTLTQIERKYQHNAGFVEMPIDEGRQAIEVLNGQTYQGRTLRVQETARILTVDNNSIHCNYLNAVFSLQGYYNEFVRSAEDALQFFQIKIPHIVLIEADLPDMDVHELCTRIQANPLLDEMKIALMSEWTTDFSRPPNPRIDGVFTTPINTMQLFKYIEKYLQDQGKPHLIIRR